MSWHMLNGWGVSLVPQLKKNCESGTELWLMRKTIDYVNTFTDIERVSAMSQYYDDEWNTSLWGRDSLGDISTPYGRIFIPAIEMTQQFCEFLAEDVVQKWPDVTFETWKGSVLNGQPRYFDAIDDPLYSEVYY